MVSSKSGDLIREESRRWSTSFPARCDASDVAAASSEAGRSERAFFYRPACLLVAGIVHVTPAGIADLTHMEGHPDRLAMSASCDAMGMTGLTQSFVLPACAHVPRKGVT